MEETPSLVDRLKVWAPYVDAGIAFFLGLAVGVLSLVLALFLADDPALVWDSLWEPVGLPTWVLLVALIAFLARPWGRRSDG